MTPKQFAAIEAAIEADIKARSRKVEPSEGGTGGLLGRGAAKQAIASGKMIERVCSLPATTPAAHQERGKSTPGARNRPKLREAQVLRACMDILRAHPKVAISWRVNTAAARIDGRFLKFSFGGASDLMMMLKGGRYGACECKATGGRMTDDQTAFLGKVAAAGGFAICVDDPTDLLQALDCLPSGIPGGMAG